MLMLMYVPKYGKIKVTSIHLNLFIAMSVPMSVGQAAQIKEEIPNFLAGNW